MNKEQKPFNLRDFAESDYDLWKLSTEKHANRSRIHID